MRRFLPAAQVAILSLTLSTFATAAEALRWETSIDSARQLAASSKRLVLIHFFSNNNPTSVLVDRDVLSNPHVSAALAPNFVGVRVNVDEAPATSQMFNVKSVPTDVIITPTPSATLVAQMTSPVNINQFVGQMTQYANGHRQLLQNLAAQQEAAAKLAAEKQAAAAPKAPAAQPPPAPVVVPPPVAEAPKVPVGPYSEQTYAAYLASRNTPAAAPPTATPPVATTPAAAQQVATTPVATTTPAAGQFAVTQPTVGQQVVAQSPAAQAPLPVQQPTNAFTSAGPVVQPPVDAAQNWPAAVSQQPVSQATAANMPPAQATLATGRGYTNPAMEHVIQLPPGMPPLVLEGFCAVSLMDGNGWKRGDVRCGAVHRGRTYLFASQQHQQKFLASPDQFAPGFNGNDPVAAIDGGQAVAGRLQYGGVYQGRMYFFATKDAYNRFNENPPRYVPAVVASRGSAPGQGTLR